MSSRQLPNIPSNIAGAVASFLVRFRTAIQDLLRDKADKIEGTIYVGREQPLVYLDENGERHQLGQDMPVVEGGVPIVESGVYPNGDQWVKFADGTFIQRGQALGGSFTVVPNATAQGLTLYRATRPIVFQEAFASGSNVSVSACGDQAQANLMGMSMYSRSLTGFTVEYVSLEDFAVEAPGDLSWMAIGRWR